LSGQTERSLSGGPPLGFEEAANLAAIPGLIRELNSLRGDLETLRAEAGNARTESQETERIGKRLDSFSAGLASLASRMEDIELAHMAGANKETVRNQSAEAAASRLAALEEQARRTETAFAALQEQTGQTESGPAALQEQVRQTEAALAALKEQTERAESGLAALREQTRQAEAGLASLEERTQHLEDAHARLHADLDKMTAAAAARVIREEIAALVAEQNKP
jgi:chromosome segregation ATPase